MEYQNPDVSAQVWEPKMDRDEMEPEPLQEPSSERERFVLQEPSSMRERSVFQVVFTFEGGMPLGIEVDQVTEETQLVVKAVTGGLAEKWNSLSSSSEVIKPRDRIVSINGTTGVNTELLAILKEEMNQISITLQHPEEFEVRLQRSGDYGVKLVYKKASLGLLIKEVYDSGSFNQWNKHNVNKQILPYDRIVAVNGCAGTPSELVQKMKEEITLILTLLRYR